jgi:bifunctional non-homologous end joining protein LigD
VSQAAVQHLAATLPDRFVAKSGPRNRVGRIYVDYLRNGRGATTVAAWSVRARPGLGVSVPVRWDELAQLRSGAHWTVRDAVARLAEPDPWAEAADWRQSLRAAMKVLDVRAARGARV